MASEARTFDPVWEQKYAAGHAQRYPWDAVVSFVFRHAPRDRPRAAVQILEVGCGTASNLWFAAREGFRCAGADASASAIATARDRMIGDGLDVELEVADFTRLPFGADRFDLAIDRGAITCCGFSDAHRAVEEIRRCLRIGGKFFFNPASTLHSSARSGRQGPDGVREDIGVGAYAGVGQICFYDEPALRRMLAKGWNILSLQHCVLTDLAGDCLTHAEWRAVAERAE